MGLTPAQKRARIALTDILKNYRGAVLHGDMGVGKTWIACDVASKYKKILMVSNAAALKDLREKVTKYETATGNILDIDLISYHKFADYKKVSAASLGKYDFFIFDEVQNLINYKAGKTSRFVRLSKGKYLHLSGTPMKKSPLDYIYVLRKCGLFESTEWFYKRYFNAQRSRYGDFMEKGAFRNAQCFQNHVDRVCVRLTEKDVQPDMPDINWSITKLKGEYTPPEDITKETRTRLKAGFTKVSGAAADILKQIRENNITTGLILCHFHDVARAMKEELGFPIALDNKKVYSEFARLAKEGGFLITTLGLTSSSLDLNECDNVFMVESTYSFPLDMQSIKRCQRIGKQNEVNVYYYCLEGETSVAKSFSRQYLLSNLGRSRLSPSQLSILEKCPGSYWLPALGDRPEYVEAAAIKGTNMHSVVENYLSHPKGKLDDSLPADVVGVIEYCRGLITDATHHGVESKVNLFTLHSEFTGTVDFWAFDGENLEVVDYKNGSTPVDVKNNLQLIAYSLMIMHTYNLSPENIQHVIYQKDEKKTFLYNKNMIQSWNKRIQRILDSIKIAEKEPLKHLNPNPNCDFFCRARAYHKKEAEMTGKQYTEADRIYPRARVSGKVIYVKERTVKTKHGNSHILNLGVSFKELPKELTTAFPEGSKEMKLVQQAVQYKDQYQAFSAFFSGFLQSIFGATCINRFDEVAIEFKIKPPKEGDAYQKITFELVSIDLIAANEAPKVRPPEVATTPEEIPGNPWGRTT